MHLQIAVINTLLLCYGHKIHIVRWRASSDEDLRSYLEKPV
jgi:hypothetical protein